MMPAIRTFTECFNQPSLLPCLLIGAVADIIQDLRGNLFQESEQIIVAFEKS